jgi:hypothetical protein
MEGVIAGILASAGQPSDYVPGAEHWPIIRTLVLVLFIPGTLFTILLLYGGNVQNKNIGPLALRGLSNIQGTLQAPRTIVTSDLDAKKVRCTFHLQFLDRKGRPRMVQLARRTKFAFKLRALNKRHSLEGSDIVGFWNMPNWSELHDALTEYEVPFEVEDNNLLMRDVLDDPAIKQLLPKPPQGEVISMPIDDWRVIAQSHKNELLMRLKTFGQFRRKWDKRRRTEGPDHKFANAAAYRNLPDLAQNANIYMRMHFSANPLTHPDAQVKTTAWLTVLTSLFALLSTWLYQGF